MAQFKKAADIKAGVIGYGGAFNMGCAHLNEMKKAGMTPTAVAEIDPQRLAVASRDFPGIEAYLRGSKTRTRMMGSLWCGMPAAHGRRSR